MKRLLLTGARGFVGGAIQAMAQESVPDVLIAGWEIVPASSVMDMRYPMTIAEEVARVRPEAVIHLAAQSFVPESFRAPIATFDVNFLGAFHLLSALRDSGFTGRVLYVSSGDVYGMVPEDGLPVSETHLPAPRSPYSVSKLAAEHLCGQWTRSDGMNIVVARPFNHIGAGQDQRFAVSDFAAQIVDIRNGRRAAELAVGDVDVTRDFLSIHDVIRAYFALLDKGQAGTVYNVCSGQERTLRSLIEKMAKICGITVDIHIDEHRLRANEQRRMAGDPSLLQAHTGWRPTETIEETLKSILSYWEKNKA
ncbi:MAG: GDP-mannose 4,6-dehydratase [Sulfuricellaceae bacterium]|nr:GDP-mannose 4,6-dehydratase [Sulfuricellaceae bacterium]